jgi:hypothetical protein
VVREAGCPVLTIRPDNTHHDDIVG